MRIFTHLQISLVKNRKVFRVDLTDQVINLSHNARILNTTIHLLFKEISREDGPMYNMLGVMSTRLMLR